MKRMLWIALASFVVIYPIANGAIGFVSPDTTARQTQSIDSCRNLSLSELQECINALSDKLSPDSIEDLVTLLFSFTQILRAIAEVLETMSGNTDKILSFLSQGCTTIVVEGNEARLCLTDIIPGPVFDALKGIVTASGQIAGALSAMANSLANVAESVMEIPRAITGFFEDLVLEMEDALSGFGDWVTGLVPEVNLAEDVTSFFDGIINWLEQALPQ